VTPAPQRLDPARGKSPRLLVQKLLELVAGKADDLQVTVDRQGFEGAVEVGPQKLPGGLTVARKTVPAGQQEVFLQVQAQGNLAAGEYIVTLAAWVSGQVVAEEKVIVRVERDPADPADVWVLRLPKYLIFASRAGKGTFEATLRLQKAGDKYEGRLTLGSGQTPVHSVRYQDGELSFESTFGPVRWQFHGKVTGDGVKGQVTRIHGQLADKALPFEGRRVKGAAVAAPAARKP
jgi:hypothetical protein